MNSPVTPTIVPWSIDAHPAFLPASVKAELELIQTDSKASEWECRAVDMSVDNERKTADYYAVLIRRSERQKSISEARNLGRLSEQPAENHSEKSPLSAGQGEIRRSGQNGIWEGKNDRTGGQVIVRAHEAPSGAELGGVYEAPAGGLEGGVYGVDADASAPPVAAPSGAATGPFSSLPTVSAMSTGERRLVVGFDTEFTTTADGMKVMRDIDSYQFALVDPFDESCLVEIVILPLAGQRILIEDALYVVSLAAGLHRLPRSGEIDPRGVLLSSIRRNQRGTEKLDFAATRKKLTPFSIPLVLSAHLGSADLTAFRRPTNKHEDPLHRVTSASGGWVSLLPIPLIRASGKGSNSKRWLGFSIILRDTMGQASPDHKSLAALGDVCGVPKMGIGDDIENMSRFRRKNLLRFLDYGVNDSRIVVEYLAMLWGVNMLPPVTLSGAGALSLRRGIMESMHCADNIEYLKRFRGLVKETEMDVEVDDNDQLSYYSTRGLKPVDGDANQSHSAWKWAFHGGWNSCLAPGFYPYETFDHDIQSAYPTSMASIFDVDYEAGCIETVVKDRDLTLEDFPQGALTPFVGYVSWEFPESVEAPCLPVLTGDSVIYPRTSVGANGGDDDNFSGFHGTWCAGPELYLALKLGAEVSCQIGYSMKILNVDGEKSRSLRHSVKQMVEDRATAKAAFGKGSLEEKTIKVATNSCYGKLAQDVSERNGWDSWAEQMESIGGSSVTSPYHASMITSLVRALLLGMANEIEILSVTTDGFISPQADIEGCEAFGIASIFRESREFLAGDPTVWEIKHRQSDLLNLTTRGNLSLEPGGVLAKAGLKTPSHIERGSTEEREWFLDVALSREGKVKNSYTSFPTTRELTRSEDRHDFLPVDCTTYVSTLDFDFKRMPIESTLEAHFVDLYELAGFKTRAWDSVDEYRHGRRKARHIQAFRPGTRGDDRPTGDFRTVGAFKTWFKRVGSFDGRRVHTAGGVALNEIVAAHKSGIVRIDILASSASVEEKLAFLSDLGFGEYTRSMWDNMSKKGRRNAVLKGVDLDEIADFVDDINANS